MEWNGMEWNGMEWNGMEWNGMEWNGMEWNGMEWNGMEWNGMEWNGMEWNGIAPPRRIDFTSVAVSSELGSVVGTTTNWAVSAAALTSGGSVIATPGSAVICSIAALVCACIRPGSPCTTATSGPFRPGV
ncbi:hypothetical protein ACWZHB_16425 [Nocardia sp. FBN12]|uniref:hypothetical protein n=1 Tax=Nocardia sp. FBN12 TaxID=3419766 RepID=UPI003D07215D